MQIGELGLELHMIVRRARYVARAAGARADGVDCLVHGGDHGGMLAHAEIVVGAPDGDRSGLPAIEVVGGGICTATALQVGEYAVASLAVHGCERIFELGGVVHQATFHSRGRFFLIIACRRRLSQRLSIVAPQSNASGRQS